MHKSQNSRIKTQDSLLHSSITPARLFLAAVPCMPGKYKCVVHLYVQINADYASCPTAAQIISRQTQASTQASSSLVQARHGSRSHPRHDSWLHISPSNQTNANPRRRAPSRRPILRPPT